MTLGPELRKLLRKTFGLAVWRWIISFSLLLYAFTSLPAFKWEIAFAVLLFQSGVAAIVEGQNFLFQTANRIDEESERKTRHTIVLAQQWAMRGASPEGPAFWQEVDHQAAQERGPEDDPPKWWRAGGLIAANFLQRVGSDLLFIWIAIVVTGA